jgi:hypothetical protein
MGEGGRREWEGRGITRDVGRKWTSVKKAGMAWLMGLEIWSPTQCLPHHQMFGSILQCLPHHYSRSRLHILSFVSPPRWAYDAVVFHTILLSGCRFARVYVHHAGQFSNTDTVFQSPLKFWNSGKEEVVSLLQIVSEEFLFFNTYHCWLSNSVVNFTKFDREPSGKVNLIGSIKYIYFPRTALKWFIAPAGSELSSLTRSQYSCSAHIWAHCCKLMQATWKVQSVRVIRETSDMVSLCHYIQFYHLLIYRAEQHRGKQMIWECWDWVRHAICNPSP